MVTRSVALQTLQETFFFFDALTFDKMFVLRIIVLTVLFSLVIVLTSILGKSVFGEIGGDFESKVSWGSILHCCVLLKGGGFGGHVFGFRTVRPDCRCDSKNDTHALTSIPNIKGMEIRQASHAL